MKLAITPETKVGELLEAFPEIETRLIKWVPAFSKLRNPVLRKTVAKLATLEQAARVGGVNAGELVARIRRELGQEAEFPQSAELEATAPTPEWVKTGRIVIRIDADEMLERGVHPIGKVRQEVAALRPGELILLTSSFRPEPLIVTIRRAGFAVFCEPAGQNLHNTYFGPPQTGS